jgi:hypothetical protein
MVHIVWHELATIKLKNAKWQNILSQFATPTLYKVSSIASSCFQSTHAFNTIEPLLITYYIITFNEWKV